jgi:hypothetical protein
METLCVSYKVTAKILVRLDEFWCYILTLQTNKYTIINTLNYIL